MSTIIRLYENLFKTCPRTSDKIQSPLQSDIHSSRIFSRVFFRFLPYEGVPEGLLLFLRMRYTSRFQNHCLRYLSTSSRLVYFPLKIMSFITTIFLLSQSLITEIFLEKSAINILSNVLLFQSFGLKQNKLQISDHFRICSLSIQIPIRL